MTVITMSRYELTRLRVLIDIADGRLSIADATGRLCHGNSIEHAFRAKTEQASCRGDGILPFCSSYGSEDTQCGSRDEVA